MKDKKKNKILYIVLIIIAVLVAAIGIAYAYFVAGISNNAKVNSKVNTAESADGFRTTGNVELTFDITNDKMQQSAGSNDYTAYIEDTGTFDVSLKAGSGIATCEYDLIITNTADEYEKSSSAGNLLEFTIQGTTGMKSFDEINVDDAINNGVLGHYIITNEYGNPETVQTWTLKSRFYNLNVSQNDQLNKKFGYEIEVANINCINEDENENSLYSKMLKAEFNDDDLTTAKSKIAAKVAPNFALTSETNDGLYKTIDDDGDAYYYRGAVDDNHVIFGGFCWRIVRTTGTRGVKLIYDGVPSNGVCNNTGTETHIKKAAFNSSYDSLAYVGYMYGEARITKSDDITTKTTNVIFSNSATYNPATDMYELDMDNSYEMIPSNWNRANASVNYTQVVKKHYTCLDNRTSCREVYYINTIDYDKMVYYQTLSNGESIDDLIDLMFDNRLSSNAKTQIDSWYENNLISYGSYLEDTIFCNDRTITDYGGWNKDNTNYNGRMYFGAQNRNANLYKPSLVCPKLNDKFTVNYGRGNGDLTYPIGLLTVDEMALAGGKEYTSNNSYYLYNGQYWWSLSPANFYSLFANEWNLTFNGSLFIEYVGNVSFGLRPAISLKPGTMVSSGNGSSSNPYVIE